MGLTLSRQLASEVIIACDNAESEDPNITLAQDDVVSELSYVERKHS